MFSVTDLKPIPRSLSAVIVSIRCVRDRSNTVEPHDTLELEPAAETVVEGFEQLPIAINMLFDGGNTGKLVVKL